MLRPEVSRQLSQQNLGAVKREAFCFGKGRAQTIELFQQGADAAALSAVSSRKRTVIRPSFKAALFKPRFLFAR